MEFEMDNFTYLALLIPYIGVVIRQFRFLNFKTFRTHIHYIRAFLLEMHMKKKEMHVNTVKLIEALTNSMLNQLNNNNNRTGYIIHIMPQT